MKTRLETLCKIKFPKALSKGKHFCFNFKLLLSARPHSSLFVLASARFSVAQEWKRKKGNKNTSRIMKKSDGEPLPPSPGKRNSSKAPFSFLRLYLELQEEQKGAKIKRKVF
jgi:hypothetical protein